MLGLQDREIPNCNVVGVPGTELGCTAIDDGGGKMPNPAPGWVTVLPSLALILNKHT